MDDAFTLLSRATGLLPRGARSGIGATVEEVRDFERRQEWEFVLELLLDFGNGPPVPGAYWSLLETAARQLMLERTARWCAWREGETRHGVFRAELTLLPAGEGRRVTAFQGDGWLRPVWDIGLRTAGGEPEMFVAVVWVEGAATLGPGESAPVRLAPLSPGRWRHLVPGAVLTLHEGRPVGGTATVLEVAPPAVIPVRSARPSG
ncbi:hypothetical protein [Streptomyces pilosus]|nr:hypothetical protein [Streptomyces pilosus]